MTPADNRGERPDALLQYGSARVFLATFCFATILGVFIQTVLLPVLMPQLHAGHGLLLGGDWIGFHQDGVRLAENIARNGWSEFELRPAGNVPVAISAIVYYFTGIHEPWILVPVNAAVFALGAMGLFNIFCRLSDARTGYLSLLPYVMFPSSVQLYSQIHKDVWSVAGFVWLVFVATSLADIETLRARRSAGLIAISFLATASAWLVRPYLSGVLLAAFLCGAIILLVWELVAGRTERDGIRRRRYACLTFCVVAIALFGLGVPDKIVPSLADHNASDLFHTSRPVPPRSACEREPNTLDRLMPDPAKRALDSIINARVGQRGDGPKAGSAMDYDVCFTQPSDVLFYIPRSLLVGLLAPFPDSWFTAGVSPGARAMRSVAGLEMLMAYAILPGVALALVLAGLRARKQIVVGLAVTLPLMSLLATAIPNIGTLYRMRYGYFAFLLGLGIIGWVWTWRAVAARRRAHA